MAPVDGGPLVRIDGPNEHADELQLKPFVKQLARIICRDDRKDPLVVSIEAPWGSGKTWCLGELQRQLQDGPSHKIAHFNPWLLSDHRQIVQVLLQKIIRCVDINDSEALKEIGRSLRKYVDGVASLAKLAESSGVGVSLGSVTAQISHIPKSSKSAVDLDDLKQKAINASTKSPFPLFVFVDDLDRVTPDEFYSTIRTIKAVADFPNVTYVLAFDAEIADQQLKRAGIERGAEFLDKVVQLRAPLPPMTKGRLAALFDQSIDSLPEYTKARFNQHEARDRFVELFHGGLSELLRSPRDVKRVFNRLLLTSDDVFKNVNLADLIALAAIDIVDPTMYRVLCQYPFVFTSNVIPHTTRQERFMSLTGKEDEHQAAYEFRNKIFAENARRTTQVLMQTLFPHHGSKHASLNTPESLLRGHISHERNLYAALQSALDENYVPIDRCRDLLVANERDFVPQLDNLLKAYSQHKLLSSLGEVMPYERPDDRMHIWDALTVAVRTDALAREAGGTRFADTNSVPLVVMMYKTERYARSDAHGDLGFFSFRDWASSNIADVRYACLWADVMRIVNEEHDRPGSASEQHSWKPSDTERWNESLVSSFFENARDSVVSGRFFDEPDSGRFLEIAAQYKPNELRPLLEPLVESNESLDQLARRLCFVTTTTSTVETTYTLRARCGNLLKCVPALRERAESRLTASGVTRRSMLAHKAIAASLPVEITESDYSPFDGKQ